MATKTFLQKTEFRVLKKKIWSVLINHRFFEDFVPMKNETWKIDVETQVDSRGVNWKCKMYPLNNVSWDDIKRWQLKLNSFEKAVSEEL